MSLQGTLSTLGITEVLEFMAEREFTGQLDITTPSGTASYLLVEGDVGMSEFEFARGLGTDGAEATYYVLAELEGEFYFEEQEVTADDDGESVEDMLGRTADIASQWADVEAEIPTTNHVLSRNSELDTSVTIKPEWWKVLEVLGSGQTTMALSKELGLGILESSSQALEMVEAGLLVVGDELETAVEAAPEEALVKDVAPVADVAPMPEAAPMPIEAEQHDLSDAPAPPIMAEANMADAPAPPIMETADAVTEVEEAPAALVVEEPVVEEPVIEEPVLEEPVAEESVMDAPVIEEPVMAAPAPEEPTPAIEQEQSAELAQDADEHVQAPIPEGQPVGGAEVPTLGFTNNFDETAEELATPSLDDDGWSTNPFTNSTAPEVPEAEPVIDQMPATEIAGIDDAGTELPVGDAPASESVAPMIFGEPEYLSDDTGAMEIQEAAPFDPSTFDASAPFGGVDSFDDADSFGGADSFDGAGSFDTAGLQPIEGADSSGLIGMDSSFNGPVGEPTDIADEALGDLAFLNGDLDSQVEAPAVATPAQASPVPESPAGGVPVLGQAADPFGALSDLVVDEEPEPDRGSVLKFLRRD